MISDDELIARVLNGLNTLALHAEDDWSPNPAFADAKAALDILARRLEEAEEANERSRQFFKALLEEAAHQPTEDKFTTPVSISFSWELLEELRTSLRSNTQEEEA